MTDIAAHFQTIEQHIAKAAKAGSRKASDVTLVAVSKKQPLDRIEGALDLGHRSFGENRVQEAAQHWIETGFRDKYKGIKLHLIGPLQSNKAQKAVQIFDVIETIDRESIIDALAKAIEGNKTPPQLFIQVNTGEEPQKAGILPQDLEALLNHAHKKGLSIDGLMCIPPQDEAAGLHFSFLKTLADRHSMKKLSMGMSGDFEKAIAAGATHIRLGSSLFGERTG